MTPSTAILAADGGGLNGIIKNIGDNLALYGGTVAVVAFVVCGILITIGFMGQGKLREHISKILIIGLGCIVLGGGPALGAVLTDTGESITNTNTVTNDGF